MKSQKTHSESNRLVADPSRFAGSVELVPPHPRFIEFVTAHQLWGFPLEHLAGFALGENPERDGKKTSPPDLLALVFNARTVRILGWRLELLLDPLMAGRVKRIHAEKYLGTLMIHEPWVSEIKIITGIILL